MSVNKNDYKTIINKGYKSVLGFYEAMRFLFSVNVDNKKSAAKDAIKILKYWEKQKDTIISNRTINYYYYDFYKILEEYDIANEYYIKYNESLYNETDDNVKKLGYLYLIVESYLSLSIKNNKVKDKKLLSNVLNYLEEIFKITAKPLDFYRLRNFSGILEEIYSVETYKVKSYARAKIVSNTFDKKYLDLFKKEDFEFYLNFLKQTNLEKQKDSLFNYVKGLYSYKYDKENYENLCRLATFFTKTNSFESYNEKKALSIFDYCLNKGYQKAIFNIIEFYLYKQDFKTLVSIVNNFLKRKSIDKEIVLSIADLLFNASIEENAVKLRYEKAAEKAANIYIKYEEHLSAERKATLSLIYTFGLGVDKNLDKAKELVVDTTQSKLITKYENQELAKQIIIKNEKYKEECEELIEGFLQEDLSSIYSLCFELYLAEKFEENKELYFKIASKYYEKDKNLSYILAQYYFFSDKEKYNQLLDEAVGINNKSAIKRKGYELFDECLKKGDLKEFNDFITEKKKNNDLEFTIKSILASVYTKKGAPKELKEKGLELCLELNRKDNSMSYNLACLYFNDEDIPQDLDRAFFYANKNLELHEDAFGYDLIYRINKAANYKFIDKEKSLTYLENSLLEIKMFASLYYEAYKAFSSNDISNPNYKKALKYLKIAAEFEYFPAMYDLGVMYFEGSNKFGVDKNLDKSFDLIKYCNEKKYPNSGIYLGSLYMKEDFKHYNPKKGVACFSEEYKTNKGVAYFLGLAYIEGKGVEYNPKKAYDYFVEASNLGVMEAKFSLAKLYYNGIYIVDSPDYETSYKFTKELIDKGFLDENNLFTAIKSLENLGKDKEAMNLINELLKKKPDSSILHYFLGKAYRDGIVLEKNMEKAIKEFNNSNSLGGFIAYNALFYIYFNDDYSCKNEKKAEEIIKEGFKKYPKKLLFSYCNYLFRNKKYKELLEVIHKYNGEEECAEYLGELYYYGLELQQDYKKAFSLFKKAYDANPTSESLMYRLGRCYFFGQGVVENKDLAKELIYKSKLAGFEEAETFWNERISK